MRGCTSILIDSELIAGISLRHERREKMEIGSKIRKSRTEAGFTQEKAAEELGVTRQTISNWENNRSYPDIISVIRMSDLYSVTLDYLLKEDKTMIEHLEESTNVVKSISRRSRIIIVSVYMVVWIVLIALFWISQLASPDGAMAFSILAFYVALPVATLVTSFLIGKDRLWGPSKWLMLIFYGVMYMLAEYVTFSLANMILNEYASFNLPEFGMIIAGAVMAAIGMAIGVLVSSVKKSAKVSVQE